MPVPFDPIPDLSPARFLEPNERAYLVMRLAGRQPLGGLKAGSRSGGDGMSSALLPKPSASSGSVSRHVNSGVNHAPGSSFVSLNSSHGSLGDSLVSSPWSDIAAAFTNKYVWYLGAVKFFRDIAGEDDRGAKDIDWSFMGPGGFD